MAEKLWQCNYNKKTKIIKYKKYIKVVGGDGTMLRAINMFHNLNLPFYGVAAGTVNFLMNDDNMKQYGTPEEVECPLLKVTVVANGRLQLPKYAFNDIVIGEFNAWIHFRTSDRDNQIGNFSGSGIVISTAAGSTGLNKNNAGPVLPLQSTDLVVSSMQSDRRVRTVVESDKILIEPTSRGSVSAAIDGTRYVYHNVDKVIIEQSDKTVRLLFSDITKLQLKRQ